MIWTAKMTMPQLKLNKVVYGSDAMKNSSDSKQEFANKVLTKYDQIKLWDVGSTQQTL